MIKKKQFTKEISELLYDPERIRKNGRVKVDKNVAYEITDKAFNKLHDKEVKFVR